MEDFNFIYPENAHGLQEKFPLYMEKILELGKEKSRQGKEPFLTAALEKLNINDNPGW
jgi:hypothetical protein